MITTSSPSTPFLHPIRVLHLEDLQADAELVATFLKDTLVDLDIKVVNSRSEFIKALEDFGPAIILSDHSLPSFDSMEALDILKNSKSKVPFILVTGAVSEEFAAGVMKNGARDYILKDRMQRLPLAFLNALEIGKLEGRQEDAEVKMHLSEKKYANLIEFLPVNIVLLDRCGLIISVNKSWKVFFDENGFEQLNFGIGCNYNDIAQLCYTTVEGSNENLERALGRVLSGELESYSAVHQYYLQNRRRWFKVIITRENDTANSWFVVMHIDITEQQLSEQLIRESEAKYRSFFENSMDGILLTKTNGQIISANPAACVIFQMSEEEICTVGRAGIVDDHDPRVVALLEERKREGNTKGELNFIRKDKSKFPGEVSSAVFTDALGQERTCMIVRDITARKQLEGDRTKLTSDLIQHSKNLEQFTHLVSHSLRGPIANILGIAHVLKSETPDTERAKIHGYLFKAVEQLDDVVRDLNRILHLKFDVTENRSVVNLDEIVAGIKSSIQNLILTEQVEILTDFSAIRRIESIKSYLQSIFYNLILNSIKFRKPYLPPVIEIVSEIANGRIRIVYRDGGIGIDMSNHHHDVFGLYKRFHPQIEGKGIGLFMVKTQVELLGGSISLESEPNAGVKFVLELPLNLMDDHLRT
jgi:PAS domain S-box-containing protein